MKTMAKMMFLVMVAAAGLFGIEGQDVSAQSGGQSSVDQVKAEARRLGTRKVVVVMKDGRRLKGFISKTDDESFDLTNSKTIDAAVVAYRDVAKIKKQGLPKTGKIAIMAGVAAGIVVLVLVSPPRPLGTICPLGCGPF
jgi:hypothetical protein